MSSDLIRSSLLEANAKLVSEVDVLGFVDIDNEPFNLTLSDEDSDWESDCVLISISSTAKVIANDDRHSPLLFQESSFIECSDDRSEENKQDESDCESLFKQLSQENDDKSLRSATYQTAFSQEFDITFSKSFLQTSSALKSHQVPPVFNEISTCIASSGKEISDLKFKINSVNLFNVIACIVICHPIREIWCKSKCCWQTMATIMIGDHHNQYFKLVLWNQQCQYALSQCCGNLVYIDQMRVTSFRGETIFGLNPKSKIVTMCSLPVQNINNCKRSIPFQNLIKLNSDWFKATHSALCSDVIKSALISRDVQFSRVYELDCGKIVHVNVRFASIGSVSHNKNVSSVVFVYSEEKPTFYCKLYLNGSSRAWISMFKKHRRHLWEIRNVACVSNSNDKKELHTTVFSTAECIYREQSFICSASDAGPGVLSVSSRKQMIALTKREETCEIRCDCVCVDLILVNLIDCRLTININSTIESCQKWLEEVEKLSSCDSWRFELRCSFRRSSLGFLLFSKYDDLLQLFELQSLTSPPCKRAKLVIERIKDAFNSTYTMVVLMKAIEDHSGSVKSVFRLISATKAS